MDGLCGNEFFCYVDYCGKFFFVGWLIFLLWYLYLFLLGSVYYYVD